MLGGLPGKFDEFKGHLSNPDGYSLENNKWILIDENDYKVIGEYDSKDEMNEAAASKIQSTDSSVKYLTWHVFGEYGMLEYILLKKGLPGHHHW